MALDRLLDLAYYELEHDPYRGMLAENSPWAICQGVSEIDESSHSITQSVWYLPLCVSIVGVLDRTRGCGTKQATKQAQT